MADEPEPHDSFYLTIECTECGWTWEGFDGAEAAMHQHTKETAHRA